MINRNIPAIRVASTLIDLKYCHTNPIIVTLFQKKSFNSRIGEDFSCIVKIIPSLIFSFS